MRGAAGAAFNSGTFNSGTFNSGTFNSGTALFIAVVRSPTSAIAWVTGAAAFFNLSAMSVAFSTASTPV